MFFFPFPHAVEYFPALNRVVANNWFDRFIPTFNRGIVNHGIGRFSETPLVIPGITNLIADLPLIGG